jgi:hypothetical protein
MPQNQRTIVTVIVAILLLLIILTMCLDQRAAIEAPPTWHLSH